MIRRILSTHGLAIFSVVCSFIAPCAAQDQQTVRIAESIWGFDDRVMQGQFVPLSILVDNLSDQPIEGTLRLHCVQGMLNGVGGDFEEPIFLGATSRRWVQFYVYVSDSLANWHLSLTTAEKEITFDPIPQSRRIFEPEFSTNMNRAKERLPVVILDPPGRMSRIPKSMKHMPNEIFPPYATATHSLYALFLDHVPNWDVPRQEAFMSWLRRGGRLHLLKDSNNQVPRFAGAMVALNEPAVEFTIGFGTVIRHDYQRADLPESVVEQVITPGDAKADLPENMDPNSFANLRTFITAKSTSEFFVGLRDLTNPEHSWVLLTLLALIYIGLLFPGSYILSKKPQYPFYTTYAAILGVVLLFSMLFLFFGRRGYNESTAVNSLMIARAETNKVWDVFAMSHAFVTVGDDYSIEDKNHQTLLASGSDSERVAATFTAGNEAKFVSRIPPFSGQPVISQRQLTLDEWNIQLLDFEQSQSDLRSVTIQTSGKLPVGEDVRYRILHGRQVHKLNYDSKTGRLKLGQDSKRLVDFCFRREFDPAVWGGWPVPPKPSTVSTDDDELEDPRKEFFRVSEADLVARSLLDDFSVNIETFELPPGEIRLLVYAPIPPKMELPFSTEANRDGRVLYVSPIRLEEAK
jgi:hypothetical protein